MATEKYLIQIKVDIQNDKQLQALTTQLQKAAKQAPVTAQKMKQATGSTRNFGNAATNTSYQLQDLIVQIQGGTKASVALSQQLPQMLIGFGAWGAAIGVVAALMPVLISQLFEASEEVASLADSSSALDSALSSIGRTMNSLDLSGWVSQWEAATEAERRFLEQTLETDVRMARRAQRAASESLGSILGEVEGTNTEGVGRAREANRRALNRQIEETAEAYGLTRKQLEAIVPIIREVRESNGQNAEAVGQLAAKLNEYDAALNVTNPKLIEMLNATNKLAEAERQLASVNDNLLPQVNTLSTRRSETVKVIEEEVTAVDKLIAANDYLQQQNEYADEVWRRQQTNIQETAEAYSMVDEATGIFLQTFDTAVNGVAQGTQSMSDAFENMTKSILLQIGKLLAIQGIGNALSGQGGFLGQVGAALLGSTSAKGNVFSGGNHLTAYAKGGVVSGPTLFPMKNGAGLMGEAGPEAIMPLTRMSNGNLGVESSGMNVVINNNAPGVDVRPRQTDQGLTIDVVMSAISQAVTRGGNEVSDSFERSYALNRGRAVYGN